eukprot:1392595-Pyramimonas_sp.AAC.1
MEEEDEEVEEDEDVDERAGQLRAKGRRALPALFETQASSAWGSRSAPCDWQVISAGVLIV